MASSPESFDATERGAAPSTEDSEPDVSVHRTSADRVVFTESDNKDGWIATDYTVEAWR